jgi:ferredoxin/flavodoxin---NADP+ reductase
VKEMWESAERGDVSVRTPYEVRGIEGQGGCVARATIFNNDTDADEVLEVEAVIALLGFKPDLGPIARWGLELERNTIKVSQVMETNLPGVYAAGDVVHYPGKLELIALGYGEAAIAVNNIVHYLNPKARVNPGHSTNLKVFKQDDE